MRLFESDTRPSQDTILIKNHKPTITHTQERIATIPRRTEQDPQPPNNTNAQDEVAMTIAFARKVLSLDNSEHADILEQIEKLEQEFNKTSIADTDKQEHIINKMKELINLEYVAEADLEQQKQQALETIKLYEAEIMSTEKFSEEQKSARLQLLKEFEETIVQTTEEHNHIKEILKKALGLLKM